MKEIRTEDAVGHILCHDITQIIKDEKKGVLFKKGHVVKEEDIPLLLSVGKEHLFVWEKKEGILHENEAAEILYKICAGNSSKVHGTDIKELALPPVPKASRPMLPLTLPLPVAAIAYCSPSFKTCSPF